MIVGCICFSSIAWGAAVGYFIRVIRLVAFPGCPVHTTITGDEALR
jgi:hypothetical protein